MKSNQVKDLNPKPLKQPKNQRLLDADGKPCPYCTDTMDRRNIKLQPTADHIRAKRRFPVKQYTPDMKGKAKPPKGRTIIVCSECNFMKGTLTLEEFIADLIERNERLLTSVDKNLSRMNSIRYLLDMGLDRSEHD